ncbi:PREDICTED: PRAME family member 8-like [Dipodomys ordii]|uniref:PRAME family member 8-like n=1 Tax=Dipodomys ordii TaxID=10020 RepID=A0A1S3F639_DIPOR|nr:PREDICTED: PRAME family member 8-like [Dipodomys ordii]
MPRDQRRAPESQSLQSVPGPAGIPRAASHLVQDSSLKMSIRTPASLQHLAMQSLLSYQALATSGLEDLPVLLFPWLFQEAYARGHTEVLKAMVQAWPFSCLPLGDLAKSPDLETFKAVLDGLDLILANKERPHAVKLQVLDLRKENPDIWTQGYTSMARIVPSGVLMDRPTRSRHSGMTEEQPFLIAIDLTIKNGAQDDLQAYLLQWAREKKERVQLCSRKLQILQSSLSKVYKTLLVVSLDSIQELVLNEVSCSVKMIFKLAPYLRQMKNLHILKCTKIRSYHQYTQFEEWIYLHFFWAQLRHLQHLQELHVHDGFFSDGNLPTILRRLTPLKTLSLNELRMQDADLCFLAQCPCTRKLKHLHLRNLVLNTFRPDRLRTLLQPVTSTLESLALEFCDFTDDRLSAILPALIQCFHLSFFSFYGNKISMAALQNLLRHMSRLRHLRLGIYPAPLESYHLSRDLKQVLYSPRRFAQVQADLAQALTHMETTHKVQICVNKDSNWSKKYFSDSDCEFYILCPDGSWVKTRKGCAGLSALAE